MEGKEKKEKEEGGEPFFGKKEGKKTYGMSREQKRGKREKRESRRLLFFASLSFRR